MDEIIAMIMTVTPSFSAQESRTYSCNIITEHENEKLWFTRHYQMYVWKPPNFGSQHRRKFSLCFWIYRIWWIHSVYKGWIKNNLGIFIVNGTYTVCCLFSRLSSLLLPLRCWQLYQLKHTLEWLSIATKYATVVLNSAKDLIVFFFSFASFQIGRWSVSDNFHSCSSRLQKCERISN